LSYLRKFPIDTLKVDQSFVCEIGGSETTQRSSAGLGLGLYISERIIAAHGGRLSVQSSLEAGTEFEVLLTRQSQRRPESQ
jgi:signal transduction histidine kinase